MNDLFHLDVPPLQTLDMNKLVALCLTLSETCLSLWRALGDLPDFSRLLLVGGSLG